MSPGSLGEALKSMKEDLAKSGVTVTEKGNSGPSLSPGQERSLSAGGAAVGGSSLGIGSYSTGSSGSR